MIQSTIQPIRIDSGKTFTFYFDMDGVLCVYDYEDYLPPKKGARPLYMIPGTHMYRKMRPDMQAIAIFKSLYMNPDHHVKVMTGLGCPYLISEHMQDKISWCHDCLAPFSSQDFLCVFGSKVRAVAELKKLSETDVLIDDFNPNLDEWRAAGGTPVKYVNHINSYREDMLCLRKDLPVQENIRVLGTYLSAL